MTSCSVYVLVVFFFNDTATTEIYTLSLHDALPISAARQGRFWDMHELLFHRQKALGDGDLRGYAARLLAWTWRRSTGTGPAARWPAGSAGMPAAAWPRARWRARRPCSSTASCTAAATARPPCWPRCPHEPPGPHAAQYQADPAGGHRRRMRSLPGGQLTVIRSRGAR